MNFDLLSPLDHGWIPVVTALAPATLMSVAAWCATRPRLSVAQAWRCFSLLAYAALLCAALTLVWHLACGGGAASGPRPPRLPGIALLPLGAWVALLVQFLGTVIGAFSARYLEGEARQQHYIVYLSLTLACVQLLLLADHWLLLIGAWAGAAAALHRLLCFYPERAFAQLAAHKKRLADRAADLALLGAAALIWPQLGSGSLSALARHVGHGPIPLSLQLGAALLALAVLLRTAVFPVHGWLIQVMEAPTPVSALLHAGVVNLGGYVLIRFAPLLQASPAARALLVAAGLGTAVLAGMVSLTRISIKVRLAWSTVAQMGFMVLECGLGLYTLAALHLLGHSLYKAQAFLTSGGAVRATRQRAMLDAPPRGAASIVAAPWVAAAVLSLEQHLLARAAWPWWWIGVLALAWAPLLWLPGRNTRPAAVRAWQAGVGMIVLSLLGLLAQLTHALALGVRDQPWQAVGPLVLAGMAALYLALATLQLRPPLLSSWRRWSYAGFYVDEIYTRAALRLWPTHWGTAPRRRAPDFTRPRHELP